MTDAERAELKRLAEGASKGPWHHWGEFDTQHVVKAPTQMVCNTLHGNDEANARFIAAANPAAVLDLLADLGKAEADNACALEHIRSHIARHEGTPTAERMKAFLAFEHPGANLFSELDALKAENERLRAEVVRLKGDVAEIEAELIHGDGL